MPVEDLSKILQQQAAAYAKLTASAKPKAASTPKIQGSVGKGGKNINADVKTVQKLLNKKGSTLVVDGDCGPKTIAAITKFQKNIVKLEQPDGRIDVNGKTWKSLTKAATTATPPKTPTPDKTTSAPKANDSLSDTVGENGKNIKADVVSVQVLLNKKNKSYALATNGLNSTKLVAAIKHYQKNVVALSNPDGRVDPDGRTWNSLKGKSSSTPPPNTTNGKGMVKPNWISIAEKEIGVKEIPGGKHNPRVIEYHSTTGNFKNDETPWCSSFVNWVMQKAGQGGTNNAMAQSWKRWGKKLDKPAYGAIAVIAYNATAGHVGFVVGKKGNSLLLLGGNQSDQVKISVFSKSQIVAYVVPSSFNVPAANYNLLENGGKFDSSSYGDTR